MAQLSYNDAIKQLEQIASTTSAAEFAYDLLRIFGGVIDTSINRIKEGKGIYVNDSQAIKNHPNYYIIRREYELLLSAFENRSERIKNGEATLPHKID